MTKRLLSLAMCVMLFSCEEKDTPVNTPPEPPVVQTAETNLAAYHAGKEIYMTHCFFCHGKDGDGKGSLAASMEAAKPRDFTSPIMSTVHPDSLKRVIMEGGEAVGLSANMPAWASTISPEDAELLVVFIQTISKNGGLLPEPKESLILTDIPQESQPTY